MCCTSILSVGACGDFTSVTAFNVNTCKHLQIAQLRFGILPLFLRKTFDDFSTALYLTMQCNHVMKWESFSALSPLSRLALSLLCSPNFSRRCSSFTSTSLSVVCCRFRRSRRTVEADNAHAHRASSSPSSNGHPPWREAASQRPGLLAGQPRGQSVSQHFAHRF